MFNDPPEADKQFFIATVSLTYSGDDASDTFYDGALEAVGPSNVGYSTSNRCGVIPDDLPSNEVFPGGTIQGNVCWEILSTDAGELLMYYDPISFGNVDRVYWSLTPP